MWSVTVHGFYSTIRWHDGRIAIRARQRSDIDRLRKLVPEVKFGTMQVTPRKDYRYRVFCTPAELEQHVFPAFARSISYGNFKSEVDRRYGMKSAYSKACHAAWSVFEKVQPKGAYGSKSKGYPAVPKSETKKQASAERESVERFDYSSFRARALTLPRSQGQDALFAQLDEEPNECEDCGTELDSENGVVIGTRAYCRNVGDCLERTVRDKA